MGVFRVLLLFPDRFVSRFGVAGLEMASNFQGWFRVTVWLMI